ncbi:hypothetical protein B296_00023698 [Ensete ventricosum]|uniref:Uncharacterized protein n=1 Tax=Ensete ventricosum TaxID=4639 RepID=A0A426ZQP6_ENSVE|nr:hypothetical protein B296_00023698 [Ensete ventricosum]
MAGATRVFGQLTHPGWAVELFIPRNLGTLGDGPTEGQRVNRPYPGVRAVERPRLVGFVLYPKKINNRYWCASRRRTQEWT